MKPRHLLFALLLSFGANAGAQIDPSLHWRTLKTEHFRVSFSDGLEEVARRAAGSAERAYSNLSKELHPPRGPIRLVVADNVDFSNGFATPFPYNRIVIYARPPIDGGALRFVDDWLDLVVVHELAHIFHLDRARGLWALGQKIFGRNPLLIPGAYLPAWIPEGLAVYYESKLTGSGRLVGTEFDATVRAHGLSGSLPPNAASISIGSTGFPLGNSVYVFGSAIMKKLAARDPDGMRKYVDGTAAWLVPFMINSNAKRAFGISFDSAYRVWSDSIRGEGLRLRTTMPLVKQAVNGGWFAERPRWLNNDEVRWVSASPKELPGLNAFDTRTGTTTRLARLNTTDANTTLPDGRRVFTQQEQLDPYTNRSDLYVEAVPGSTRRVTVGARLIQSDARICESGTGQSGSSIEPRSLGDICVVAVQIVPAGSKLVHVRINGSTLQAEIRQLTPASTDELYSEPRWSHGGDRIVASHWSRSGLSAIDILDAGGRIVLKSIGRSRAINAAPAWGPGDSTIYFTSDRSGASAIYRASVATGALERVATSPTGLFESEPSPDGRRLATFQLANDGLNLALIDIARGVPADSVSALGAARGIPISRSDAPVVAYSAWRDLLPTYWLPTVEPATGSNYGYGFLTGGADAIGRHTWSLSASLEPKRNEPSFSADYEFAGFGLPIVGAGAEEIWEHFTLADTANKPVGILRRRKLITGLSATYSRPRYGGSMALTVGGAYEIRDDDTEPSQLILQLDPAFRQQRTYPSYFISAAYGNARQPSFALGPENGISVGATYRQRWRNGAEATTRARTVSGSLVAYRAFDFGGWAHHLLALRTAAWSSDVTATSSVSAGGNSGGLLDLAPGITAGDGRRMFFVRGTDAGVQSGSSASAYNVEYRFPISMPSRGFWKTPLFLQKISGTLFHDAATAWCPNASANSAICPRVTPMRWMSSVGAELNLDAAIEYDFPVRFRIGVATPTQGSRYFTGTRAYFTLGSPF